MRVVDIFNWAVSKTRPKIRTEPERPLFPDRPGLYEDDIDWIAGETITRKYGEREMAPPGRRLHWIATNDATGQLLKGDARRQAAPISAPGSAAGPASTKGSTVTITPSAPKPRRRDLREKIKTLRAEIRGLEAGRKK